MTYEEFIDELRDLFVEGEAFRGRATLGTPEFRDWRHRTESTVAEMQAEGFAVPGGFKSRGRLYQANWVQARPDANKQAFERDLGDSLSEIKFIVERFDRDGPPRSRSGEQSDVPATATPAAASHADPLLSPEKVTFLWILENVSVKGWLIALGIATAIFLLGFSVAQTSAGRATVCFFKHDACSVTS
jgi:hypothetical protein